jgi:hypothetical protein
MYGKNMDSRVINNDLLAMAVVKQIGRECARSNHLKIICKNKQPIHDAKQISYINKLTYDNIRQLIIGNIMHSTNANYEYASKIIRYK